MTPSLPVLGLPGSAFLEEAESAGLRVVTEAFADRAYTPAGTLVPRTEPGAVGARPRRRREAGSAVGHDGHDRRSTHPIVVPAETICVHGDTPAAVAMAAAIRRSCSNAEKIHVKPFV